MVNECNLAHVRSVLAGPERLFYQEIQRAFDTGDLHVIERLSRFERLNPEDREQRAIVSAAKAQTGWISNTAFAESLRDDRFRFAELRERPTTVYLILPGDKLQVGARWFRLLVSAAVAELMQEMG